MKVNRLRGWNVTRLVDGKAGRKDKIKKNANYITGFNKISSFRAANLKSITICMKCLLIILNSDYSTNGESQHAWI